MSATEEISTEPVKVLIEVVAGVIPGTPEPEFGKKWTITSREWEESDSEMGLLAKRAGEAEAYMHLMMMHPEHVNWVRLEVVWA